jgi:DNA-binding IclR family transcriptional regulator
LDAIQSKSATARVISVLRLRREGIALRELARFARVAPSTAHRVAHQLEERGFARIEAAGQERRVGLFRPRVSAKTRRRKEA